MTCVRCSRTCRPFVRSPTWCLHRFRPPVRTQQPCPRRPVVRRADSLADLPGMLQLSRNPRQIFPEACMPDFSRPLRRSKDKGLIAGVVAGLANYFNVDVTLLRVVYVVVSILSVAFPGILVYIILWFLVPEE